MFADPFSNLMLVVLLFFAGLLIMFIFMMRSIEANWRNQEETRRQMALSLSDLERKVNELSFLLRAVYEEEGDATSDITSDTSDRQLPELSFSMGDADGRYTGSQAPAADAYQETAAAPGTLPGGSADNDILRFNESYDEPYYEPQPAQFVQSAEARPDLQNFQNLPDLPNLLDEMSADAKADRHPYHDFAETGNNRDK